MPLPAGTQAALLTAGRVGITADRRRRGPRRRPGRIPSDIDIEVHGADIDALVCCYRLDGIPGR